jgi:hypothetical protein
MAEAQTPRLKGLFPEFFFEIAVHKLLLKIITIMFCCRHFAHGGRDKNK